MIPRQMTPRIAVCLTLILCGCAGMLPGGKDTVNAAFYKTGDDLGQRAAGLEPGMGKDEVFAKLGRGAGDFTRLSREEILAALFGSKNAQLNGTKEEQLDYLRSLSGYSFQYKIVKRRIGFTDPISVRTDTKGFDYRIMLVFQDDKLFEKPVVSGGAVRGADSKTLFDYLNPGLALSAR
jgi:hypothetical protein